MAWTEEQISTYQIHNKQMLEEVNATLRPDENLSDGKVGIFIPGQAGDLCTAMSVLKYRDQIFGNKKIIWYANQPNCDCLKYAPIFEVRPWPWANNGLPEGTPDFWPLLMNENNRLNKELAKQYELTADLDEGYFPAPYMLEPQKRHGIDYPNCSKKVFGVPDDYEWHPVLSFSNEDITGTEYYISRIPEGRKILFESFAGSDQSKITHEMIIDAMTLCKTIWPNCSFIFASHKYLRNQENFPDNFFEQENVFSAAGFTVRQCALLNDHADLIISVSSGITVACSSWGRKPVPIVQYCGSWVCSTLSLAKGRPFELITADNKTPEASKQEFETRLIELLNELK